MKTSSLAVRLWLKMLVSLKEKTQGQQSRSFLRLNGIFIFKESIQRAQKKGTLIAMVMKGGTGLKRIVQLLIVVIVLVEFSQLVTLLGWNPAS